MCSLVYSAGWWGVQEDVEAAFASLSPAARDFLAGAGGGLASVFVGHPLDTVRVFQQAAAVTHRGETIRSLFSILSHHGINNTAVREEKFRSRFFTNVKHLFSTTGLYRGVFYPAATIGIQSAIVFQAYGVASRYIYEHYHPRDDPRSVMTYTQVALAGGFAGLAQLGVIIPVELLKIRAQLDPGVPLSPVAACKKILSNGGFKNLYRGACITTLRDLPCHCVYFGTYEIARELGDPGSRVPGERNQASVLLAAGGLAGVMSWLVIYPLDVIKTRVQLGSEPLRLKWGKSIEAARQGGLWAGVTSTVVRAFIVNAVLFYSYDALVGVLGGRKKA